MNEFFTVVRQYYKGDVETHSMEVKTDYMDALQRFFNIVASDLANAEITYQATYIVDSNGLMKECRVFDRTIVTPVESEVEG